MEAIAVCLFGLESTVAYELKKLGYKIIETTDGRVTFEADGYSVARANISLRCAERILVKVGKFKADRFDVLFDQIKALPFEQYLDVDSKFDIAKVRSINSKLVSQSDIQSIAKKAIVERLKSVYRVEWFSESKDQNQIHIFINKDIVEVSFDTTGPALHKRGYRARSGDAPIRETIAAFMVMLTPWKPNRLLVDPMCGSGTIAIEAALYGANISPGINRSFAGEDLTFIRKEAWQLARKDALEVENREPFKVYAFDKDHGIIDLAGENAKLAGVDHLISFKQKDILKMQTKKEYGFLITNPPYGERMGEKEEIESLYKGMGKVFQSLPTWSIYVISSHDRTEELFGRKAEKKRKIYNGSLRSNYYLYPGPKPPKLD